MEVAQGSVGAPWDTLFDTGGPCGFIYRGQREGRHAEVLVGVLFPSRDAVGRRFPFTVYAALPLGVFAAAPHCVPYVAGAFADAAYAVAAQARTLRDGAGLEALVARIAAPSVARLEPGRAEYAAWLEQEPLGVFAGRLLGAQHPEIFVGALSALAEAIRPMRGEEASRSRLALRLPVGAPRALACTFWQDAVRQSARWRKVVPTSFWSLGEDLGSMLVQLGETPDGTLSELWAPRPEADHVCDIGLMSGPASVVPSLAPHARFDASIPMALQTLATMG